MKLQNKFKIRCSAIGQIMTEPKSKADKEAGKLSATCLKYVHDWIKSQPEYYNRYESFRSKYTLKGLECEQESIDFASRYFNWGSVNKNTEFKQNEYLTGTADVILPDSVEDIKNSWSQSTFPLFDTEIPIDGYGWQLQGYMALYEKHKAGLIYTLMDAPERMIDKEANSLRYELGLDEIEYEMWEKVKADMTYSNIREEIRIKRFFLNRDDDVIQSVYDKVEKIRNYIENL